MRRAAFLIVTSPCGHILALRREKGGKRGWGLPGGKQEDGEDDAETARRETKEETGLDVHVEDLLHVHDVNGWQCAIFRGRIVGGILCSSVEGEAKFVEIETFLHDNDFAHYNQIAVTRAGLAAADPRTQTVA